MMRRLLFILAGALVVPITANAALIAIDFDDLASGTVLTNQYTSLGVTFSASENGSPVGSLVQAFTSHTSPNVWSNCFNGFCTDRADILRIDFSSPVSNLQWYTDTAGSSSPTFNAYDSVGSLIETTVATATSQGIFALTSFSATNISYVEGIQPDDSWGYLVDTLSFQQTVPEPGTLALLCVGVAGATLSRRRPKA